MRGPAQQNVSRGMRACLIAAGVFLVSWVLAPHFAVFEWLGAHMQAAPGLTELLVAGSVAAILLFYLAAHHLRDLHVAEDHYRQLFEANPFPMWIYDLGSYRFIAVNEAACKQYGYSRDEFLGMTILDIRPEEDREAVKRAVHADGSIHGPLWRHVAKGGRLLEVEITSHALSWMGKRCRMTLARDLTGEREAEELLRRREEQLRLVLESTGDGLYSLDLVGKCVWCNPAAARILGFDSAEALIGRNMHNLVHHTRANGEPYPQAECEMMRAALQGQGVVLDDELLWRADGSQFHADYRSNPILRDGKVAGVVVSFADVEARHVAEELVRRSEARFRALAGTTVFGMSIGGNDGQMLEANDAYLNLVGYSREDLASGLVRWDTGTAPEYRNMGAVAGKLLRAGQSVPPWRSELIRKDGSRVPVLVTLIPVPEGAINLTLDLTPLRDAEQSLQASERRYRELFENSLAGVFSVDLQGRIVDANPAWVRIAGAGTRESVVGQPVAAILHGFSEIEHELRAGDAVTNREWKLARPDGREVAVLGNIMFLPDRDGAVGRYEGTVIDITDYKSLEVQLFQAQKMEGVGQLAGGIAHDFNNLLTVINGYSGQLRRSATDGETQRRLDLIIRAGERAATLTRQLLAFSRSQVLELRVVNLNAVIQEAVDMLRRMVGEKFEIELALAADLTSVKADGNQIELVLMNLVVNARDAMPKGGRITVETQNAYLDKAYALTHHEVATGNYAMMAVTDTGCGMDEAVKARVFEPFFTTKPQGQGTGLGLATVFGIVKQSGGTVSVYSEPGRGTSFKVYLPAHGNSEETPVAAHTSGLTVGDETILLVEDEEDVRLFAAEVLGKCGYRLLCARDADEAVAKVAGHGGTIDLLVTDVVMPGMDGPALAQRLREQRPLLRTLYVSGYPSQAVIARGVLWSDGSFLQKPYSPEQIAAAVRAVLDGPMFALGATPPA